VIPDLLDGTVYSEQIISTHLLAAFNVKAHTDELDNHRLVYIHCRTRLLLGWEFFLARLTALTP